MNKQKLTRVFIVDDNHEAIEVLRYLLETAYSVEVVGTAGDAETAAQAIVKSDPDIIFLDVELPTMSGLEFCSLIRQEVKPETKVVFYTGHDKYMLDAIRREAFDYLLKPPTPHDLSQIMTRYYENKLASIPSTLHHTEQLPIILVVNSLNEHTTLRVHDIAYFRYNQERKIWEVVCMNAQVFMLRHRTTADVILNYAADFIQIHKRYIVNINQIKMIQESACILMEPMEHCTELRISKNYRTALMAAFYSL
ncbi:MAG: response regulator transcription factor [Prevotella sp.]|nr:response regulator transcription factor [Prevotella sp.]